MTSRILLHLSLFAALLSFPACHGVKPAKITCEIGFDSPEDMGEFGARAEIVQPQSSKISRAHRFTPWSGGYLSTTGKGAANIPGVYLHFDDKSAGPRAWLSKPGGSDAGRIHINGAMDFFFRLDAPTDKSSEFRPFDHTQDSIRWVLKNRSSLTTQLAAELVTSDRNAILLPAGQLGKSLRRADLCDPKSGAVLVSTISLSTPSDFVIEGNTPYHLAMSFATDEWGDIIQKLYVEKGTGPINTRTAIPKVTRTFQICGKGICLEDSVRSFFFGMGHPKYAGDAVHDFERLRFFQDVPTVFPRL